MLIYLMLLDDREEKRLFVTLYEKYRQLLYKVANDVLHDSWLAEDAVHETFIKLANNMNKIEEEENSNRTKRYLITVVKHAAIDIYRKRKRNEEREVFVDEIENMNLVYNAYENINHEILDILINLPVKYRDIFLLKYSAGYENHEIAEILDMSESAIRQRISRGKKLVEKELYKIGIEMR